MRNNAAFFATGNNLVVVGDMTRRALVCALDAKTERPETREFDTEDPLEVVRRDRARYVMAALTILRAFHVAGQPKQASQPLGSFEVWSRWVRDALIWLGEPDPCRTMDRARVEDPQTQELAAVLNQWKTIIRKQAVTVKEVIERATDYDPQPGAGYDLNVRRFLHPDFREALLVVAGDGGSINSRKLGTWLGKRKGRVIDGMRLVVKKSNGENRWQALPVN